MATFLMIIQLLIVLGALWVGSRYGSLALGAISGIGLAILVFGFGMKPGSPPTDVIYIIIAAVTCAGIMQASGGMDWLIQLAEKLLRKHPDRITFLAPLCTFFLTVLVGTGHVVYTLMPIICDISLKKGIRPERPCGVASIASQVGITCSPIAAAVVAFVSISSANGFDVTIPQVLMITIPACLCGLMAAATASYHRGLDLDKDPEFQAKLQNPEQKAYIQQFVDSMELSFQGLDSSNPSASYEKWIDVPSFVDYFIHTELSLNADGFKRSAYFFKDKDLADGTVSKMQAGPVWDYNLAYGNCNFCNANNVEA